MRQAKISIAFIIRKTSESRILSDNCSLCSLSIRFDDRARIRMLDYLTEMSRAEFELMRLSIALNVVFGYTLTNDKEAALRRLILDEADCPTTRLHRALSMLVSSGASSEEI